jgi:GNAT superfamily N-acetyltransferase
VTVASTAFEIRPMTDRKALDEMLRLRWSDGTIFVQGKLLSPSDVEAIGAYYDNRLQGIATYRVERGLPYMISMNNVTDRRGVGIALLEAMIALAREQGAPVLRVLISNDNWPAFRFYQKRGFLITTVHTGVVNMIRMMKPSVPDCGVDGIPMRDEIELELVL